MPELNGNSLDILEENIKNLRQLFPEVECDGKIDFDMLRQILGEYVDDDKERYNFKWNGKGKALRFSQTPSTGTLRPCKEESKDWDDTQNLYIEGDNLEVLKILQKSYHGKIKMIYIDPPYNTGKDFVYPDNYHDSLENYKAITGQTDEEGRKISTNTEASGRFHTDWLNMMYPRLRLARNLLTKDGVIFISIDDNEVDNLRRLCNEIFGEENYINTISANMKNNAGASGGGEDKRLKKNCEFILVYTKSYSAFSSFSGVYDYTEIYDVVNNYKNEGKSWHYTSVLVDEGEKVYVGSTVDGDGNEIKIYRRINAIAKSINKICLDENISEKEVYYKYGTRIFEAKDAQSSIRGRVIDARNELKLSDDIISIEYIPKTGKNKGILYEQFYKGESCRLFAWLRDITEEIDGILYKKDAQGTYWDLTSYINNLSKEGEVVFPNGKKPVELIKRMLKMYLDENDIILDFFSGSATTAHAVMQLNAEDGGNRRFICVQLPEPTQEDSEAFKAGYKNICEIGKERIRRAGEKIKTEIESGNGQLKFDEEPKTVPDIGFKVFKLDSSNLKKWNPDFDNLELTLDDMINNYVPDRTEEDVVYEFMLKMGLDLSYPVDVTEIDGKKVYSIGFGALMMCLDDNITVSVAEGMVKMYKELAPETWKVIFKDEGFADDCTKTNIKLTLIQAGLEEDAFTTV